MVVVQTSTKRFGPIALVRHQFVGEQLAEGAHRRNLELVAPEQAVDLLDPPGCHVAPEREGLEALFHREQRRLGEAGVGHVRRQADVEAEVDGPRDQHLAAHDDQHVGAHRRLFGRDVRRQGDVEDHGTRLALAHVEHA